MDKGERKDVLTPRQMAFIQAYLDRTSKTFGNALQSALKAGYSQSMAKKFLTYLPDKVSQRITEELDGKDIQSKIVKQLSWLTDILSDPKARERKNISDTTALRGLELLGKFQKMFVDRMEVATKERIIQIVLPADPGPEKVAP